MFEVACGDGRLTHDRLERERLKQAEWRAKSAAGGKKSAEMRQNHNQNSTVVQPPFNHPSATLPTNGQPPTQPKGNIPVSCLQSPSPSPNKTSTASAAPSLFGETEKTIPAGKPKSDHVLFAKGWCDRYQVAFGDKYPFDEGKDGKAIKELLKKGIPVEQLLSVAQSAWEKRKTDKFCQACKKSGSIHAFRHAYNDIATELNIAGVKPSVNVNGSIDGLGDKHEELWGPRDRVPTKEQMAYREAYWAKIAEHRRKKEEEDRAKSEPAVEASRKAREEMLAKQQQAARELQEERENAKNA
jgi:hypothetical protein